MNWLARLCLFVPLAGFALTGCCTPNEIVGAVSVQLRPQETNNWCWAATTQMITEYYGHGRSQCELANERFSMTTCCEGDCPKNSACNIPGWTMFAECGFDSTASATPLSWYDLKCEIDCDDSPLSYAYGPKSGGVGHVLVISGYARLDGTDYVALTDPWDPCDGAQRWITYSEYSSSGTSNHWETSYNFHYNP